MPEPERPTSPVILTGATGFIGRRLQSRLLAEGYRLRALVRPNSPHRDALQAGVEAVTLALGDAPALRSATRDAAAVVYLAGSVRGRRYADFEAANVDGVARIAAALEASPTPPPLLLISSLAATRPEVSYYARSKFAGEQALARSTRIPWTILRPPAVYGPGDKELRPLLDWARRGLVPMVGPRTQRLSLLHVDDLAGAVAAWLADPSRCRHRTFAIDDGRPGGYGWPDIGRAAGRPDARLVPVPAALLRLVAGFNWLLSAVLRYAPMLSPGKVRELRQPDWLAGDSGFGAATGWRPRVALEQGVRRLFA